MTGKARAGISLLVPELREPRVEVDVGPALDSLEESLLVEVPADVDQQYGAVGDVEKLVVRHPARLLALAVDERSRTGQAEPLDDGTEVGQVDRALEVGRLAVLVYAGLRCDLLYEVDVEPESLQAEHPA